ncbi:MAG: hypothetical protein V2J13_11100, partial [Cycloclasticus sp.]|nr:hypothetical protein [Cycloclasticus sp.]
MGIELSEKPKKRNKFIISILFIIFITIGAFGGYYIPRYIVQYLETEDMIKEKNMLDAKLDKFQSQKELFISNIDRKYKDVKFLIGQDEIEAALKMIDDFKRFEVIDYKDIAKLYKHLTIEYLVNESIKIPQGDLLGNFEMYNILHELDPDSNEFKYKNIYYRYQLFDLMDLQKTPEYI